MCGEIRGRMRRLHGGLARGGCAEDAPTAAVRTLNPVRPGASRPD